jgi:hypothetical protein
MVINRSCGHAANLLMNIGKFGLNSSCNVVCRDLEIIYIADRKLKHVTCVVLCCVALREKKHLEKNHMHVCLFMQRRGN